MRDAETPSLDLLASSPRFVTKSPFLRSSLEQREPGVQGMAGAGSSLCAFPLHARSPKAGVFPPAKHCSCKSAPSLISSY